MSEALTVTTAQTPPQGIVPTSVTEIATMAEQLALSSLVPDEYKGKPQNVYLAIAYGMEVGLAPVTALMSIAVIKGKPSLYAASMVALVLSSGKAKYFRCVESSAKSATYETLRHGSEPVQKTFTVDDAKTAGLLGGMYAKYPKQMLEARAKSMLARDCFPDVLAGLASYEEIVDYDAPPAREFSAPPPAPEEKPEHVINFADAILACKTQAELDALAPDLAKLGDKDKTLAKGIWKQQQATIKGANE